VHVNYVVNRSTGRRFYRSSRVQLEDEHGRVVVHEGSGGEPIRAAASQTELDEQGGRETRSNASGLQALRASPPHHAKSGRVGDPGFRPRPAAARKRLSARFFGMAEAMPLHISVPEVRVRAGRG
jgi:hypothetical protein